MSNIDSKPLENLARASLAQDREIAVLRKQLSNTRDELSSVTTEHNDVLDVLIAADMWTGNPPYRGVSAAGQVQMILDALAAMTAERDTLKAQLDAVPVEAIIAYRANSDESEGLIRYGNHEAHVDFAQATETLDAWLETQVEP